jgi:hypothetical protein
MMKPKPDTNPQKSGPTRTLKIGPDPALVFAQILFPTRSCEVGFSLALTKGRSATSVLILGLIKSALSKNDELI